MLYKVSLVARKCYHSDIMVGGDEVQVQEVPEVNALDETQTLTNEDVRKIKEEVDEKEADEVIVVLLTKIIDTIMMEEFFEVNRKMNLFRIVLAEGIKKFAEEHEGDKAKMDRFVDAFRAGWKVHKVNGDKKATLDAFMKAMDNELWFNEEYPLRSEHTKA